MAVEDHPKYIRWGNPTLSELNQNIVLLEVHFGVNKYSEIITKSTVNELIKEKPKLF